VRRSGILTLAVSCVMCASGCDEGTPDAAPASSMQVEHVHPRVGENGIWTDPVTELRLAVIPTERHPFLHDHGRALIVLTRSGGVVSVPLLGEPGGLGPISNLYRGDDGNLILIDMNGIWFTISKRSGRILLCESRWEEATPQQYLGRFEQGEGAVYGFVSRDAAQEEPIYLFKDPDHPLLRDALLRAFRRSDKAAAPRP